jgi:hypothetical protein
MAELPYVLPMECPVFFPVKKRGVMIGNNKRKTDEPIFKLITKKSKFYLILVIIFAGMILFLQGCSHSQFRAYLLDIKPDKSIDPYQMNLAANDIHTALPGRNYYDRTDDTMVLISRTYKPQLHINDIVNSTNEEGVLNIAKKDIEIFYITAHYLRANKMDQDLEMLAEVSRNYLNNKIDPLLHSRENNISSDVHTALTVIEYYKAHLLYEINDMEGACNTVSDLESSYHHESTGDLGVLSKKLDMYKKSFLVMTDFSYMCDRK